MRRSDFSKIKFFKILGGTPGVSKVSFLTFQWLYYNWGKEEAERKEKELKEWVFAFFSPC